MAIDYTKYGYEEPLENQQAGAIDYSKYGAAPESMPSAKEKPLSRNESIKRAFGIPSGGFMEQSFVTRAGPKIAGDILESGIEAARKTFEEGPAAAKFATEHPIRTAKHLTAGGFDVLKGIGNLPHNVPSYLASIGEMTPEAAKEISKFILPVFDEEKREKLPPEEEYLRGFAPMVAGAIPAYKLLKGPVKAAAKIPGAALGKENPVYAAQQAAAESKLADVEKQKEMVKEEAEAQRAAHKKAVDEAKRKLNLSDAERMEYQLNEHTNKVAQNKQKINELNQRLEGMEKPEAPSPLAPPDIQHIERAQQAVENEGQAASNVKNAETHLEESKKISDEAENNIADYLNEGAAHHRTVGRYLKNSIEGIFDKWKSDYKDLMSNIKNNQFQMTNIGGYEVDMAHVLEQLKAGVDPKNIKASKVDNPVLKSLLEKAPTPNDTSASDFLTKYKELRDAIFDEKQRMKDASATERKDIVEALEHIGSVERAVKKALDNGLGPYKKEFERVNAGYTNEVYPLRSNSVARKALKEGKVSSTNMLEQLTGDQPGHEILRNLIKQDPEMLKHLVGQRYGKNPAEIHNPPELLKEYTDLMPELQRMTGIKKQAENAIAQSENNLSAAKEHHAQAKQNVSETAKSSKEAQTRINKAQAEHQAKLKEHEKKVSAHEKEVKNIQKKIGTHQAEIEELNKKIPELEKQMNSIRKEAQKLNISLKKKMELERKHKALKKEIADLKDKREKSATGLKKYYTILKNLYKIGKKVAGL